MCCAFILCVCCLFSSIPGLSILQRNQVLSEGLWICILMFWHRNIFLSLTRQSLGLPGHGKLVTGGLNRAPGGHDEQGYRISVCSLFKDYLAPTAVSRGWGCWSWTAASFPTASGASWQPRKNRFNFQLTSLNCPQQGLSVFILSLQFFFKKWRRLNSLVILFLKLIDRMTPRRDQRKNA